MSNEQINPQFGLSANAIAFFQQQGLFIPGISFTRFQQGAKETPTELTSDSDLVTTVLEYPLEYENPEREQQAKQEAVKLARQVFGKGTYEDPKLALMVNTSTTPIRIGFCRNYKEPRKEIYIKAPDGLRMLGKYLYNIISGYGPYRFYFSEDAIIEEGIPGNTLAETDERLYLHNPKYRAGLVRATIHGDLMNIY